MIFRKLSDFFARQSPADAAEEKILHARSLFDKGQQQAALSACRDVLQLLPDHYESICLLGEIIASCGDARGAIDLCTRAIELSPEQAVAYYKRANILKNCGRAEESLADYDKAIALDPEFGNALCNRGVVLQQLNRLPEALESYSRAIDLSPADAFSYFNRATVLRELNRFQEAQQNYEQAIAVKSDYAESYCNLGLLHADLKDWQAALASYDRCLEISPGFVHAHFSRGVLQQAQGEWAAALSSYDRTIELKPDHAEAFNNRGVLLTELRQWSAAYESLSQAIALRPRFAEAHYNKGTLMAQLLRPQDAIANFDEAIAIKPDYADALQSRGEAFSRLNQFSSAIESYDNAIRGDPQRPYLLGMHLHARMHICDWADVNVDLERLVKGIEAGEPLTTPFPLLALLDRPELQLKAAQLWARDRCSVPHSPALPSQRAQNGRMRIGYFSGDFFNHPVSMIMAGVIESHDRSKFEVIAFSYGPDTQDAMRRRLETAFDRFIDVRNQSDQEVAAMARSMGIDIAIDLAGYTGDGRTRIFAWRAAPVQISFLGYPGTMGGDFVDYVIGDDTVLPIEQQKNYSEKIIHLPACFLPVDSKREIAGTELRREQYGLPALGFVFCCFNNSYKITPEVFDVWMRILRRTPDSVFWLSRNNDTAASNILREALRRGIGPERIIFADRLSSHAQHLARHSLADLFLDTFPYNAHATAMDALCAGLPLITRCGKAFPGRVAASLLKAFDLPELITVTIGEYEDLAVRIALNPVHALEIKTKLSLNRTRLQGIDTGSLAANLEAAFEAVQERYRANLPPDHICLTQASTSG